MMDMVTNEVVAAIAAPTIGESMCRRPKRTMLSRAAKRKAEVSGNRRSRVRQVLVAPFRERAMMPETIESVPRRLVTVGRSCRNEMAKKVAKSGVLLVKHDVMDAPSRSIPLNMKKRATPGTKMPTISRDGCRFKSFGFFADLIQSLLASRTVRKIHTEVFLATLPAQVFSSFFQM